ncbi:MAG: TrkA family potassium uptake protein [Leptospira sp.]|nr:TrkA family potassium uptake protein [Leptospira sp.]
MKKNKIAVIGLGDFGKELVKQLFLEKHEVVAIDKEMLTIDEIKDHCTNAICLDATDEHALRAQGLEEMDFVILATADDLETLVITADILRQLGVKEIIARYKTELHIRILKMLGITNIFNPEEKAARNMAEQFGHSSIKSSLIISEEFRIAELVIPELFAGKTVEEIQLKENYNLLLITIKRMRHNLQAKRKSDEMKQEVLGIPQKTTVFRSNDIITVFGKHEHVEEFLNTV